MFRIRGRAIAPGGAGWWPTGEIRATVAEVQQLLGDDFARLEDT